MQCYKFINFSIFYLTRRIELGSTIKQLIRRRAFRGCHEKKQTRYLNFCFYQYNLLKSLHMTQIGQKNRIFNHFLVRLLNPCWSAFIILPFKWSNILEPYQIPLNIFEFSISIDPYSWHSSYQHLLLPSFWFNL